MAEEAITGYLEALKIQGRPIPEKDAKLFFGGTFIFPNPDAKYVFLTGHI